MLFKKTDSGIQDLPAKKVPGPNGVSDEFWSAWTTVTKYHRLGA